MLGRSSLYLSSKISNLIFLHSNWLRSCILNDDNLSYEQVGISSVLVYIQQDATLHSLFHLKTALSVSESTTTHHQERKQLYLQHLVFVTPLLLPAAIAAGSSNSVTNTKCCRYSCFRPWWWVVVPPETRRAVSRWNKLCKRCILLAIHTRIFLRCTVPRTLKIGISYYQPEAGST